MPERCHNCREPVHLAWGEWVHEHTGETHCGTGDGSTAYPESLWLADEVDRRYRERFPDSDTKEF